MAAASVSIPPTAELPVEAAPTALNAKGQERLGRTIAAKLAQGYRVESRGDEQAALVLTARRWLGMFGGGVTRELVSINRWGHPSIQTCVSARPARLATTREAFSPSARGRRS